MNLNSAFVAILKFGAMLGFIICSTLVVGLNFKAFKRIFEERTATMWWLFLGISVIPFVMMVGIFTMLFKEKTGTTIVFLKDGRIVNDIAPSEFTQATFIKPQDAVKIILKGWQ